MAGDDDHRLGARVRAPARPRCAPAACRRSRPAACSARPCGVERPAASTIAATRAAAARRRGSRARLRPRDDLHQQPADAHAGDVLARHRQARRAAASAPSRSHSPSASARSPARRAPARPRDIADQHQVAGIDRHAEMLDRAAGRLDRGRDDIAPVGDGRRAEHEHELGALAAAASSIAAASASSSCGTRRSATIARPPARAAPRSRCKRLVDRPWRRAPAAASRRRRPC